MKSSEVPEPGSYGAETVPHTQGDDEEQPNDTGVSDDEQSELDSRYEIPTGEEESVGVEYHCHLLKRYILLLFQLLPLTPHHHQDLPKVTVLLQLEQNIASLLPS